MMNNTTQFQQILDRYRKDAFSERDKGDKFERLMQGYLKTAPIYKDTFSDVWMWSEFPCKGDFAGGKDLGIDMVCKTKSGEFWAVQCKFYDESTQIAKEAVDTFLSTSGKQFIDNETQQETRFTERLWISTSDNWSSNAEETIYNQQTKVSRIGLAELENAPVEWDLLANGISGEKALQPKKHLREHQQAALEHTHAHFLNEDRGKLIMACGTGKTFTSLKIAEHETQGKGLILFLVPSIALLGQTLREWSAQADKPINSVCICSDSRISETKARRHDINIDSVVDLGYPATTDVDDILHQFKEIKRFGSNGMTVVFSTYQSIERIAEAQKVLLVNGYPEFDLIFWVQDEN